MFLSEGSIHIARSAWRRLPHWRQIGVAYFITFRLGDSLPHPLLRQWRHERAIWLRWHPPPWGMDEQCEYEERFIDRMQEWLDAGMGVRHMRRSDVRKLLGRKSTFWMGESYDHIVRDVKELAAFRNYIGGNPAKAGLEPTEYSLQLRNVLMP